MRKCNAMFAQFVKSRCQRRATCFKEYQRKTSYACMGGALLIQKRTCTYKVGGGGKKCSDCGCVYFLDAPKIRH